MTTSAQQLRNKSKRNLQSKLSLNINILDLIADDFREKCEHFKCQNIPILNYLEGDNIEQEKQNLDKPQIQLVFRKDENEYNFEKLLYKNDPMETGTLLALQKVIENAKIKLVTLKLEDCTLTAEHIEILRDILVHNPSIQEVSVSGNPNLEQNHYLLMCDTHVLYLTLKFCKINADGMEKISETLSQVTHNLKHLNLASNCLFDEGARSVAGFLRINRSLTSLNLADNKIRNVGCFLLMEPLAVFILREEELVVRRKIVYKYLKTVNLSRSSLKSSQSVKTSTGSNEKKQKERKSSKCSIRSLPNSIKGSTKGSIKSSLKESVRSKYSISSSLQKDPLAHLHRDTEHHPFIHDAFQDEDKNYFCKGNATLTSLNLSYNRISSEGLQEIIRTLNYQKGIQTNSGLSRLILEGNAFGAECINDLNYIEDLLKRQKSFVSDGTDTSIKLSKGSSTLGKRKLT